MNIQPRCLVGDASAPDDFTTNSNSYVGLSVYGATYADEFLRAYLEDEEFIIDEPGHEDWRDADEIDDD